MNLNESCSFCQDGSVQIYRQPLDRLSTPGSNHVRVLHFIHGMKKEKDLRNFLVPGLAIKIAYSCQIILSVKCKTLELWKADFSVH